MNHVRVRTRTPAIIALLGLILAGLAALVSPAASAAPAAPAAQGTSPAGSGLNGLTSVTTAPGLAATLVGAGVVPLPVQPASVRARFDHGFQLTYGFPVTGGNPRLDQGKGHILHAGGIDFVNGSGDSLEIGSFDIALAAGKIFAREVNSETARIPVLDLDLSQLQVSMRHHATVLSKIGLYLDPAAASALNATFHLGLPEDGSLRFGTGRVTLRN